MTTHSPTTLERLRQRKARVALVGAGYAALPLGLAFTREGVPLLVHDIDAERVRSLNAGRSYIKGIPDEDIQRARDAGLLEASTDPAILRRADAVIICVPTPLGKNREPDLSAVKAAGRVVAEHLQPGQLVSLESTTYPGTTDEVLLPLLRAGGREVGKDFFLVFSPERVDPGNTRFTVENTPKVVGGMTPACAEHGEALYGTVVKQVVRVSSPRVAEAAKLLENIYRCVNIALVNELKVVLDAMDVDVWEVVEAAKTKPFGFQPFYPGPGLGGHCIPIDPFYLSWKAREYDLNTRFIELAGEVNSAMPRYVLAKVAHALNEQAKPIKGSRVLVLGVAYKRDVDDARESPAIKLIELLQEEGADVVYHDPFVPVLALGHGRDAPTMRSTPLDAALVKGADCVLIVTDHSTVDHKMVAANARAIVDTRNAVRDAAGPIVRA